MCWNDDYLHNQNNIQKFVNYFYRKTALFVVLLLIEITDL